MTLKQQILDYPKLILSSGKINSNTIRKNTAFWNSSLCDDINKFITDDIPISLKIRLILNDKSENPKCVCGKLLKFNGTVFNQYCSTKCAANSDEVKRKQRESNLERFGVEFPMQCREVREKCKTSTRETLGVDYPMQSEKVQEKMKKTKLANHYDEFFTNRPKAQETCVKKYGVKYYSQNNEWHTKVKETCANKFGVESFFLSNYFKNKATQTKLEKYNDSKYTNRAKAKETSLEKYGVEFALQSPVFLEKMKNTSNAKYGVNHFSQISIPADSSVIRSRWEELIALYLTELGIKFERNTRKIIAPLELDFYLPDHNVAIEINGNYWHSEIAGKKDKNYHFNKWMACREKDISLYSYFEDELIDNIEVIKSKLRYLVSQNTCVIGARKCSISNVTYKDESDFLNKHHIQGSTKARNKTIGAYYNNKLVAVFSWQLRKEYLEITRFACDTEASYPGLFSKMMKHMITELAYTGKVVSFSNNGHSNGGVYNASGFTLDKILGPAYWYTFDYLVRENRQRYMKSKIATKFSYDMSNKTEWQAMQELGYDRIWDSGKVKWVKEII